LGGMRPGISPPANAAYAGLVTMQKSQNSNTWPTDATLKDNICGANYIPGFCKQYQQTLSCT